VYDITPSPAIGDINSDGVSEIIITDSMGMIYAWSGVSVKLIWESELGQSTLTSPVFADLNNDNIPDVIVGSDNSRVYALDGISGQVLYKSDFIGGRVLTASAILVDDFDMDGFKDIAVTTDDNIICFLYSPITGDKQPFYYKTPDVIMTSPVIVRNKNGMDKIAVATNGGKIYLFDTHDLENKKIIDITQKINMLKGVNLVLNDIKSTPVAVDIDGDGTQELVFVTGSYYLSALNIVDERLLWAYKITPFSAMDTPLRYASPVTADFNMDEIPDIAIGWANGKVIVIDGTIGEPIWEYNTTTSNRIISSLSLADFNKDGIVDLVVAGEDGSVFVLNGRADAVERMLSNKAFVQFPVTSTPVLGDINGDGMMDVIVTAVNSSIHIFTTPLRTFKNEIVWGSFRKNSANAAATKIDSKDILYKLYIAAGILIILIIVLSFKISKTKRLSKLPKVIRLKN
jgi:outer membrane protein assembly factor BamB